MIAAGRSKFLTFPYTPLPQKDVLLAKLEWAKLGEPERQIRDAAGILEIQGENLDQQYVERWAAALDIEDQLHAAREKAG